VAVICILGHSSGFGQTGNSLLYEISGNGLTKPSYVYGTFHLLCPQDLSIGNVTREKLLSTEQLVLELDFDDPEMPVQMGQGIMLKEGSSIKDYLSNEEYAELDAFLQKTVNSSADPLAQIKPAFISSLLYPIFLECQPVSLEQALVQMAQSKGNEILGLESVDDQIAIFDQIPYEEQASMLMDQIRDFDNQKKEMDEFVEQYKSRDMDGLYNTAKVGFEEYPGEFDKIILDSRNQNWIPKMENMMKAKSTFFGVGAAHLGGEEGVLQLLSEKGYVVTKVLDKEPGKDNGSVSIVKKWRVEASTVDGIVEEILNNVKEKDPAQAKAMAEQKIQIANMVRDTVVEYLEDGTYQLMIPGVGMTLGKWTLDGDELKETNDKGENTTKQLIKLTNDELHLIRENGEERKYVRVK
jgi:uncharacterized protein YbaP (TraB family)